MPDRTPHAALLLEIAEAEPSGGVPVPFVRGPHRELQGAGLVTILERADGAGARVRCTSEGLDVAREIEGEGA